jgi:oligosaccharide reducing-end xylanase
MSAAAAATTGDLDTYGSFLQALVDEPIPSGDSRYYDGMLYLIAFLAVSGNVTAFGP